MELMDSFQRIIKMNTAMNKTDINKAAETILIPLFRETYNYTNLENINDIEDNPNYPSIDLGDKEARVAIQVQPVDALRGTIDRNRKTEKKELCQHIP
jgi:hypothetical protein